MDRRAADPMTTERRRRKRRRALATHPSTIFRGYICPCRFSLLCLSCSLLLLLSGPFVAVGWTAVQQQRRRSASARLLPPCAATADAAATTTVAPPHPPRFFLRPALPADMGRASQLLADGFFNKSRTGFFGYHYERLVTYLSLDSSFPRPGTRHHMAVACDGSNGVVWGVVELDGRIPPDRYRPDAEVGRGPQQRRPFRTVEEGRPYMCNLAVDEKWRRSGVASALVKECEKLAREWHAQDRAMSLAPLTTSPTTTDGTTLWLKARKSNDAAVRLYTKLGYRIEGEEVEGKTNESVLLMGKELAWNDDDGNRTTTAVPLS